MKKLLILFFLVLSLILSGCKNENYTEMDKNDTQKLTELVQEQEILMYKSAMANVPEETFSNYLYKINNQKYENRTYIYFGRATCPNCREFVLSNDKFSKIKGILYVDTDKMTVSEKEELAKFGITEVPTIIKIFDDKHAQKITIEDFNKEISYN